MGCGRMQVKCDDGFEVITKDQNELVALVQWHGKNTHHQDFTADAVLKMSHHP
ncbi:MAG: hypothetical protein WCA77_06310 [Thermoplasmata archaeon]